MKTKVMRIGILIILAYILIQVLTGCQTCEKCRQVCYECDYMGMGVQTLCSGPTTLPQELADDVNYLNAIGYDCQEIETEVLTVCQDPGEELILNMENDGYLCYQ